MAEASTNTGASHQAPESSKDMAGNCLPSIPSEGKVLIPHHLAPTLCLLLLLSIHQHARSIPPLPSVFVGSNNLQAQNIFFFFSY